MLILCDNETTNNNIQKQSTYYYCNRATVGARTAQLCFEAKEPCHLEGR